MSSEQAGELLRSFYLYVPNFIVFASRSVELGSYDFLPPPLVPTGGGKLKLRPSEVASHVHINPCEEKLLVTRVFIFYPRDTSHSLRAPLWTTRGSALQYIPQSPLVGGWINFQPRFPYLSQDGRPPLTIPSLQVEAKRGSWSNILYVSLSLMRRPQSSRSAFFFYYTVEGIVLHDRVSSN